MKYAIKNNTGSWWNGECFGVKEIRKEYTSLDDLPLVIDGMGLEVFATRESGGFLDARYYESGMEAADALVDEIKNHECISITTANGHGAYCKICGETLA